jgi:hypothetical protein
MGHMKILCMAFAGVLTLGVALEAHATDADAFLGLLRKFGITTDHHTAKKPCLCSGGFFDGTIGVVTAISPGGSGYYGYECRTLNFLADGTLAGWGNCGANGTFTVLSK